MKRLDRDERERIMCQLCFDMFEFERLRPLLNGKREDVCWDCYWAELVYGRRLLTAAT